MAYQNPVKKCPLKMRHPAPLRKHEKSARQHDLNAHRVPEDVMLPHVFGRLEPLSIPLQKLVHSPERVLNYMLPISPGSVKGDALSVTHQRMSQALSDTNRQLNACDECPRIFS